MREHKMVRLAIRELSRVRPGLIPLATFTILLGLVNLLVVNQKIVLYVFYIPVVFAAWMLPKRDAVGVAALAALLVLAYIFIVPGKFVDIQSRSMFWAELLVWSGILVVTAYLVSILRGWTQEAISNLQRAYWGVLSILSKFIQTVDADTEAHSVRVGAWSVCIAKQLGLKSELIEEVRIAGLLHDVGKVDISVDLLRKAAKLSQGEQEQVREHAARGAAMIKPVGGILSHIADAIEMHHEKYDGSGYRGLKGEEIPLAARIVAAADVFDALLSDRPYRKGMAIREAIDHVVGSAGTHFDPQVVAALSTVVNRDGEQALAEVLRDAEYISPTGLAR